MFILDLQTGEIELRSKAVDSDYPDEVLDAEWNPELDKLTPMQSPGLAEHEEQPEPVPTDWILGALADTPHC